MFSRLCLRAGLLLVALGSAVSVSAATKPVKEAPMGQFAAKQIRHIATYFPGRMAGSPAELLAADYLKQQFTEMGYPADTRTFDARYLYTNKDTIQRESGVRLYPLSHISYGDYSADKYEKEMTGNLDTVVRAIQEAGA